MYTGLKSEGSAKVFREPLVSWEPVFGLRLWINLLTTAVEQREMIH